MLLPVTEWTRSVQVQILANWPLDQEFLRPHPVLADAPVNQPDFGPYKSSAPWSLRFTIISVSNARVEDVPATTRQMDIHPANDAVGPDQAAV